MVKVIGTKKSKHLKEGVTYEVTEETAKILVKKGDATKPKKGVKKDK